MVYHGCGPSPLARPVVAAGGSDLAARSRCSTTRSRRCPTLARYHVSARQPVSQAGCRGSECRPLLFLRPCVTRCCERILVEFCKQRFCRRFCKPRVDCAAKAMVVEVGAEVKSPGLHYSTYRWVVTNHTSGMLGSDCSEHLIYCRGVRAVMWPVAYRTFGCAASRKYRQRPGGSPHHSRD